jgi:enoyl-CoA hydratase/carnithine racemase
MQEEWFSLSFSIRDGIGKISLDDKSNHHFITTKMLRELKNALKVCHHSKDVNILVITGNTKCFSLGMDKNELAGLNAPEMADFIEFGWKVFNKFNEIRKPVIAQVSGNAWDGGFELSLLADLVYATPSATFGFPGMKHKNSPAFGGISNLIDIAGCRFAKELLFTGRCINAEEALSKGIVNGIFNENEIDSHVERISKHIMENDLETVGYVKSNVGQMLDLNRRVRLSDEINSFSIRNARI